VVKRIVVPLDGSERAERALPVARTLAARTDAEVVVVGCAWQESPEHVQHYLDAVTAFTATGDDPLVGTRVIEDQPPPAAILQAAAEHPDSVVCMTTHGRGRLRWALVGSVAEKVLRAATRPVLLVGRAGRPRWDEPSRRVVACVDGSEASTKVTDTATEWARELGLQVVLTVVRHPLDVPPADGEDAMLSRLAARVTAEGVRVHTEVATSTYVAGSLADVAETPPAALVVMATHARTALARVVLGSVTMGVVHLAPCPVLVVPPSASPAADPDRVPD